MRRNGLKRLAAWVWVTNLVVCLALAGFLVWFNFPSEVKAVSAPAPQKGRAATVSPATPWPTPTRAPTITPWPTPIPGPSMTPIAGYSANRIVIGFSVQRRPLEVFRYGSGSEVKLIVAGIHGGAEINTIQLADQLIAYLDEHPDRIPEDTTLYILRNINPDGAARDIGPDGHGNADGVDLNHNWPYRWQADWARDGCWNERQETGGPYGGSEPEVQNLITFIERIRPAALISYHSAALGIFPGGQPDFGPSINLARAVAAVSNYPYPPIQTGCGYTGNLTDWAASTHNIPAIDIELTNHVDTDFTQNLKILQVFLAWKR